MKICTTCGMELDESNFHRRKKSLDGLSPKCKSCCKLYSKEYSKQNKEKISSVKREYYLSNRRRIIESSLEWSRSNSDRVSTNKKVWYQNNKDKCAYYRAKRRSAKINATPSWLTNEHLEEIKTVYEHAKIISEIMGSSRHVDHDLPLQGELVCGLHVPWNLKVLPAKYNLSKGNRIGDYYE